MVKKNLPFTIIAFCVLFPFNQLFFQAFGFWSLIIFAICYSFIFMIADALKAGCAYFYLASPFLVSALFVFHNLIEGNHWSKYSFLLCAPLAFLGLALYFKIETSTNFVVICSIVASAVIWIVITPLYFLVPMKYPMFDVSIYDANTIDVYLYFYCLIIWILLTVNHLLFWYKKNYTEDK